MVVLERSLLVLISVAHQRQYEDNTSRIYADKIP